MAQLRRIMEQAPSDPTLFPIEPPSVAVAWAETARIPLDATFKKEVRDGRSFWYARWPKPGRKMGHEYVGKEAKLAHVKACHEVVRKELAALEAEIGEPLRRLVALEKIAYSRAIRRTHTPEGPGLCSVPIFDASTPPTTRRRAR